MTAAEATPSDGDEGPGYAAAMAELETILVELEADDPDVDVLAGRIERAAELLAHCRDRIAAARVQVERVVATLEEVAADTPTSGRDDDPLADDPDAGDAEAAGGDGTTPSLLDADG